MALPLHCAAPGPLPWHQRPAHTRSSSSARRFSLRCCKHVRGRRRGLSAGATQASWTLSTRSRSSVRHARRWQGRPRTSPSTSTVKRSPAAALQWHLPSPKPPVGGSPGFAAVTLLVALLTRRAEPPRVHARSHQDRGGGNWREGATRHHHGGLRLRSSARHCPHPVVPAASPMAASHHLRIWRDVRANILPTAECWCRCSPCHLCARSIMKTMRSIVGGATKPTCGRAALAPCLTIIAPRAALHFFDGGPLTAQYLLVIDTLNFCFWPESGLEYEHLARGLKVRALADRCSVLPGVRQHVQMPCSPRHVAVPT